MPLVQGIDYDRGCSVCVSSGCAGSSAHVQVSAVSVSAGAPVPLTVAEAPAFVHGSGSVVSASAQVPPAFAEAPAQAVGVCDCLRVRFAVPPVASLSAPEQTEEEDDDAASVVSNPPVVDKALAQLAAFIYDECPESHPLSAPPLAPLCGFESFYALSDPPESTRPRFRPYPCVEEIVTDIRDRASTLAKTSKPLSEVLPKHRR